eukprot:6183438-Pleurochrysis_carterae.AAC.3
MLFRQFRCIPLKARNPSFVNHVGAEPPASPLPNARCRGCRDTFKLIVSYPAQTAINQTIKKFLTLLISWCARKPSRNVLATSEKIACSCHEVLWQFQGGLFVVSMKRPGIFRGVTEQRDFVINFDNFVK